MEKIHARRKIRKDNYYFLGDNLSDDIDDRIQNIPSIKDKMKQCEDLLAFIKAHKADPHFKNIGIDISQIENQYHLMKELVAAIDKFDDLFSGIGWIAYEKMNTEIIREAVAKGESGDIEGAQADLARHYDPERVKFELKRMAKIKSFNARMPLARKALIDYKEERYYACVPVVLALLDGMINEVYQKKLKKRCGFFAENANLLAWDSVAAHSKGLNELAKTFRSGRYTTTTNKIDVPYRNGILHGMDLGYDNKIVAAKTWAALFAASEWVIKAENDSLAPPKPEKEKTQLEILIEAAQKYEQTQRELARIAEWKPRSIKIGQDIPSTGNPEEYEKGTPERKFVEFLVYWKAKNYGYMAQCVSKKPINNTKVSAGDIKKRYDQANLQEFEIEGVCDTASARSVIKAKLVYEWFGQTIEKSFDFILINYDDSWNPAVSGTPGSNWYVYNWDRYI